LLIFYSKTSLEKVGFVNFIDNRKKKGIEYISN